MDAIDRALADTFGHDIGAQYWFRRSDGETTLRCVGLATRRPPTPVVPRTTFHAFSTTKPITALAVLQLVDKGELELDAPLARWLPDLPYRNRATVRQVLSHQAGLPNPLPLDWVHRAAAHAGFDHDAFLANVLRDHPKHGAAGARARYSNIGFLVLGRLVAMLSGTRYVDYVHTKILDVVRDRDDADAWLDFTTPDGERHATGYTRIMSPIGMMVSLMPDRQKLRTREGGWLRYAPFYLDGAAYGGLVGNARGWAPVLSAIAGRDERLLSAAGYRDYFAPQSLASGERSGHAMSWFTGRLGAHDFRCHAGGGPGYGAEIRVYPELGAASAVLSNTTIVTDTRMLDRLDACWLA
ncbi:MAG TPA: serine hydrolase domain-containing protein [Nannocystaceae bacterium]|nr:serine hydrolase domain-containing protein [Nannocystaceae bacterium]